MKNFGFNEMILLDSCEITSETYQFAVKAEDLVKKAKKYQDLGEMLTVEDCNYLIGTTARIGGSKNPKRNAVPSVRLRSYPFPSTGKIGVLFGPEQAGLENEEIQMCDLIVTIPTAEGYPSLNLSHAVGIIAYELSLRTESGRALPYEPSKKKEREVLVTFWRKLIEEVYEGKPRGKIEIYKEIMENLAGRSFLTRRETHSLIGITKEIRRKIKNRGNVGGIEDERV